MDEHVSEKDGTRQRSLNGNALPGDVVFVPHGWWHMVNPDELNIAVTHNYGG
jgi:hypothetical protein